MPPSVLPDERREELLLLPDEDTEDIDERREDMELVLAELLREDVVTQRMQGRSFITSHVALSLPQKRSPPPSLHSSPRHTPKDCED